MTEPALWQSLLSPIAAAALLFAAARDLAVRTVPDAVPLIVAAAGLVSNGTQGHAAAALLAGGMVFAAAWCCWWCGWLGGGDVKLLGACAILVPPALVPAMIEGTAAAGGLLALLYLALERLLPDARAAAPMTLPSRNLARRVWRVERRRIRRRLSLPYCCAIAAGALLTVCSAELTG